LCIIKNEEMRFPYILLFITIALSACNNKKKSTDTNSYSLLGDTIVLEERTIIQEKIKVETVKIEKYNQKLATSGIVKAIPNNYAQVAAPFSGRILRSFVKLGQHVAVDAPIFEISSPSFFEASKGYYQSKQEMQLASKNLKRQQDLLRNGVGVQRDVEEAEVNFELMKRDYENSIASLKVYHVNPDELVLGQPLIVRSPIKGEIVENNIVIGQYLKEDAEPVAIVAELNKVWVVGQLKEKDINAIHEADSVVIKLPGVPETEILGKVFHISDMLDEATRSVQVFIECDNNDRSMKPGMYVTAQFSEIAQNSILIPSSSVLQMEESSFVFVRLGKNKYLKRSIETAGTDNERIIIKSGLNAGEEIVTEGGFYLLEAI
jgi:membrane fusion protein, heavy metal efflux system